MLSVTSFWTSGKFTVADVDEELAAPPVAFRRMFPYGAVMVETAIEMGTLTDPGTYRFVYDYEKKVVTSYETVED